MVAVFPERVELETAAVPELKMPPPELVAEFPERVVLMTVRLPPKSRL